MLNIAIAMVIILLSAPPPPKPRLSEGQRAMALAFFAGLGLANHHSIVFLTPLGLTAAILAARRSHAPLRTAIGGLGMLALGLSPYLYLMYAARHPTACTWGDTSTPAGLLHHFLRADYGTFNLAASTRKPSPLLNVTSLFKGIAVQSAGVALFALVPLFRKKKPALLPVMFAVSFLAGGPGLIARFNTYPVGLASRIVERFYLFPLALVTVFAAIGITHVIERYRVATLALVAALIARAGFTVGDRAEEARYRGTTEAYVRDVLAIAPPNAILLVTGDDAVGGFFYAKCGLHLRDDVTVITPVMLLTDWYPARATKELQLPQMITHGVKATPESEPVLEAPLVMRDLLATNRPVLLNEWFATTLARRFPSYPYGPVIRVVDPTSVPNPEQLLAETEALYKTLATPGLLQPPPPRDTWPGVRGADYARPWNVLAEAFERGGDPNRAAYCRDRAALLTPH